MHILTGPRLHNTSGLHQPTCSQLEIQYVWLAESDQIMLYCVYCAMGTPPPPNWEITIPPQKYSAEASAGG